jgi:hypothetical protein
MSKTKAEEFAVDCCRFDSLGEALAARGWSFESGHTFHCYEVVVFSDGSFTLLAGEVEPEHEGGGAVVHTGHLNDLA